MRTERQNVGDRGWALVSVLWAMTMLSLMAAATEELAIASHRSERRAFAKASAEAVLNAGLTQAVVGISAPSVADRWRVDGIPKETDFGGVKLTIRVQDEAGRYDLNAVDPSVLMTLLEWAGAEPGRATALANSILEWRSPPGPHRLNAATDEDYAAAGLPYYPRHAAFESVDELRLVLGMDDALFNAIRPALTIYSRRAAVDPAIAPKESLIALYNGDKDRAEMILNAREAGDDSVFTIYPDAHKGVLNAAVPLPARIFEIRVETSIDGRDYERDSVVMLTGDRGSPYITLWSSKPR